MMYILFCLLSLSLNEMSAGFSVKAHMDPSHSFLTTPNNSKVCMCHN